MALDQDICLAHLHTRNVACRLCCTICLSDHNHHSGHSLQDDLGNTSSCNMNNILHYSVYEPIYHIDFPLLH